MGPDVFSLVLYIAMSLVLTGIVRYDTLNSAAPVAAAFAAIGLPWVTLLVSAAAVAGCASPRTLSRRMALTKPTIDIQRTLTGKAGVELLRPTPNDLLRM